MGAHKKNKDKLKLYLEKLEQERKKLELKKKK